MLWREAAEHDADQGQPDEGGSDAVRSSVT